MKFYLICGKLSEMTYANFALGRRYVVCCGDNLPRSSLYPNNKWPQSTTTSYYDEYLILALTGQARWHFRWWKTSGEPPRDQSKQPIIGHGPWGYNSHAGNITRLLLQRSRPCLSRPCNRQGDHFKFGLNNACFWISLPLDNVVPLARYIMPMPDEHPYLWPHWEADFDFIDLTRGRYCR